MSKEPAYIEALDAYQGRMSRLHGVGEAWLAYLVTRLPEGERLAVVKAMRAEKYPRQYMEELEAKAKGANGT